MAIMKCEWLSKDKLALTRCIKRPLVSLLQLARVNLPTHRAMFEVRVGNWGAEDIKGLLKKSSCLYKNSYFDKEHCSY